MTRGLVLALGGLSLVAATMITGAPVSAQYFDDTDSGLVEDPASPEAWALELRIGPYQPAVGAAFDQFFSTDVGPLLAFELDFLFLEFVGWVDAGVGAGLGWVEYDGKALDPGGMQTGERTSLTLLPMPVVAVVRVDALARQLDIPLLVTGKIGADFVFWTAATGDVNDGSNVSIGLRWGVQAALELDIFSRRAARALDEEWGINHTFAFFEIFGSTAETTLPVGPKGGVAWTAGLGFLF